MSRRLDTLVDEAIAQRGAGERAALIEAGAPPLSYQALAARIIRVAAALHAAGLQPEQRVMLIGENAIDAVVLLLATARAGGWAVPVNARLSPGEIDSVVAHCRPQFVYFGSAVSAEAAAHAERLGAPACTLAGLTGGRLLTNDADPSPATDRTGEVALMLYTSGSTGQPKGVMLTHANLDFVTAASVAQRALLPGDRVFDALPMSHSFGLVSTLLCGLRAGATLQLVPRFSAGLLAAAIRDDGITVLHGVPAMYARLQEWSLTSGQALQPNRLRLAYIGGSQIDPERKARAEALLGLQLHQGYGMTECAPAATRTIGHPPPAQSPSDPHRVTAGWPIPGVEVELRDGAGRPVVAGTPGEVWIRGPNVMKGYFRDAAQTRLAVDADGWLHSGDTGEFGPQGDLAIVGRLKEMIIHAGFNIYPAEVERAIVAFPGVAQSAVVGRAIDGDEQVIAFVEPMQGAEVDVEALRGFLRLHLAPYKMPAQIVCLPELPATSSGKLLKARLKAMAAAGLPAT